MEVIHTRCAGLDVHKQTVVACLRMQEGQEVRREVRRWSYPVSVDGVGLGN
jgi:hypothetical protein